MTRYEIINHLIKKNKYYKYLEIGTQIGNCIEQVNCAYKIGVDPDISENVIDNSTNCFEMTSNEFFKQNTEKFDIIFIDGLHEAVQVVNDIHNSLAILNDNGVIMVHDVNPQSEEAQDAVFYNDEGVLTIPHRKTWNGDVWKAWASCRATLGYVKMYCIDTDEGCGIIKRGNQELYNIVSDYNLNYNYLDSHRVELLNLISVEEFLKK